MKNKNQKNLKNKKFRWGAYGRTKKYLRGCAPQNQRFTAFSPVNIKVFSEKIRGAAVFCRTFANENERQSFEFFERLQTAHTGEEHSTKPYIYNIIYANLSPVCEYSKYVLFCGWLWNR